MYKKENCKVKRMEKREYNGELKQKMRPCIH